MQKGDKDQCFFLGLDRMKLAWLENQQRAWPILLCLLIAARKKAYSLQHRLPLFDAGGCVTANAKPLSYFIS
ncbi:MAG: hypothetical protein KF753_25060 [Caldilineaceae bacterium]|nr:hypothetical protein [Caldilineaceae bacterium]